MTGMKIRTIEDAAAWPWKNQLPARWPGEIYYGKIWNRHVPGD